MLHRGAGESDQQGISSLATFLSSVSGIQYDLGYILNTKTKGGRPNNDQTRLPVRFVRGRPKLAGWHRQEEATGVIQLPSLVKYQV